VTFPAFWLGYRLWFGVEAAFDPVPRPGFADELLGQLLVIALPEEMFYRGYLQTRLERAFDNKLRLLGAQVGAGVLLTSAIFAVGHFLSTPDAARLAVFFPSLLFGWLRARTGAIGSAVLYHAACNLFSSYLAHGYGLVAG